MFADSCGGNHVFFGLGCQTFTEFWANVFIQHNSSINMPVFVERSRSMDASEPCARPTRSARVARGLHKSKRQDVEKRMCACSADSQRCEPHNLLWHGQTRTRWPVLPRTNHLFKSRDHEVYSHHARSFAPSVEGGLVPQPVPGLHRGSVRRHSRHKALSTPRMIANERFFSLTCQKKKKPSLLAVLHGLLAHRDLLEGCTFASGCAHAAAEVCFSVV